MQKRSILNQITLCADGSIGLQWLKQIVDDDGSIILSEPHRGVIDAGMHVGRSIAPVHEHLKAMGFTIPDDKLDQMTVLVNQINALGRDSPLLRDHQSELRKARNG